VSNWSPALKSIFFLAIIVVFYGISVYHYKDNISVLPEVAMMAIGVIVGFFAEVANSKKSRIILWIMGTISILLSILIAVFEIISSNFGINTFMAPSPARLALLLAIFDIMWIVYNRIWEKINASQGR
jgi:uncharacterized membrane protein